MGVFGNGYINNNVNSIDESAIEEMGFEDLDEELIQEAFLSDPHTDDLVARYKSDIKDIKSEIKYSKDDVKSQIKNYEKLKKVFKDAKTKICALNFGDYRVRVSVNNFTSYLNSDFMKTLLFGWYNQVNNAVQDSKYLKAHRDEFSPKESGVQIKISFCRVIDKNIESIDKKIASLK